MRKRLKLNFDMRKKKQVSFTVGQHGYFAEKIIQNLLGMIYISILWTLNMEIIHNKWHTTIIFK